MCQLVLLKRLCVWNIKLHTVKDAPALIMKTSELNERDFVIINIYKDLY